MFQAFPLTDPLPAVLRAFPAVHELRAPAGTAAHVGLAVRVLAGLPARPVLWVSTTPDWYPPGLAGLGLDPARCLFAQAKDDAQALSSTETALRGGMAAVVECREVSRLTARRLALAARQSGALGLVLRVAPARTAQDSSAFASRWMVQPAPQGRVRGTLLYAQGGMPGEYVFMLEEERDGPAPLAVPVLRRTG